MSDIHFVCHKTTKKGQLGENPHTVFNFGSLSLETIKRKKFAEKKLYLENMVFQDIRRLY